MNPARTLIAAVIALPLSVSFVASKESRVMSELKPLDHSVAKVVSEIVRWRPACRSYDELRPLSQIAFLWMVDPNVHPVKHRLIRAVSAEVQDKPRYTDFIPLIEHRWCEKRDGAERHTLTIAGELEIAWMIRRLCEDYNIHELMCHDRYSYSRHGKDEGRTSTITYVCTCGERFEVRRSRTAPAAAASQFAAHLRHVGCTPDTAGQRRPASPSIVPVSAEATTAKVDA